MIGVRHWPLLKMFIIRAKILKSPLVKAELTIIKCRNCRKWGNKRVMGGCKMSVTEDKRSIQGITLRPQQCVCVCVWGCVESAVLSSPQFHPPP